MSRLLLLGIIAAIITGCGVQGPLYRTTDTPKADAPSPQQKETRRKERRQTYGELSEQDQNILPDLLY